MHKPGEEWMKTWTSGHNHWAKWADLAADAEPVVPVSKVAEWLIGDAGDEQVADLTFLVNEFRDDFGRLSRQGSSDE